MPPTDVSPTGGGGGDKTATIAGMMAMTSVHVPCFSPEIPIFAATDLPICTHVQDSHLFLVAGSVTAVLVVVGVMVIIVAIAIYCCQKGT